MKSSFFDPETRTFPHIQEHAEANLDACQLRAYEKFVKSMGGLCWWQMGEGKTRISLFWFATLQNFYKWSIPSICVVVCRRRAFYDWKQEINKLFPDIEVWEDDIPVHPPTPRPCFLLLSEGMISKLVPVYAKMRTIRAVIIDELWLYANPRSNKSEAIYRFGMGRKCLGLSGSIMNNRDTASVWAQARAVSKHMRLASCLTKFREKYQICSASTGFPSFSPKPGSYKKIMDDLDFCSDVHFPVSSRRLHEQYHEVPATPLQQRYFRELREFYSIEDHSLEFDNAMATAVKAQQISDGFIKTREGHYTYIPTNKFEKLKDELEIILANGHRAVVWCAFRHTVEMLSRNLPFATLQMLGGVDFDAAAWVRRDADVCIATEASGSSVNYFRDTPYSIYYSANYKWKDLAQSKFRTNRKDSAHSTCYYKYLCVEGSLDRHVFDVAMGSGDRETTLLKFGGVRHWLAGK